MTDIPAAHPAATVATAKALVAEQFPEYASLEFGELASGWDNAMIRLGPNLAVRMPRTEEAVGSLMKERELLGRLGHAWTFAFPRVVGEGEPGHGYPWPWSVITWLDGTIAATAPLSVRGAASLGEAIAQIHEPAPPDAPYNDEQSLPMDGRAASVAQLLEMLKDQEGPGGERIDVAAAERIWERAMAAPAPTHFVWSHADLHGFNVLSGPGGSFAGIIDWGDMAACDPAVDVGYTYSMTDVAGVTALIDAYRALRLTDPTFEDRVKGVALHKCLQLTSWPRPTTAMCGWRGLVALGVARTG